MVETLKKATLASNTLAHEPNFQDVNFPLIYEIVQHHASIWKPKQIQGKKSPNINIAKRIDLSVKSRWNAGDRRGFVDIQYVPGAPTCFVNDYVDIEGNVQPGLKKLGYDLKKTDYYAGVKEGIHFANGVLFLENWGGLSNRVLCEFVYLHSLNEASPHFARTRNTISMHIFRPLVAEEKAEKPLHNLDAEVKSANLLGSLRSKNAKGEYAYDSPKMDAILSMHSLGGGLGIADVNQKLATIYYEHKKSPVAFLNKYNESMDEYKMSIAVAQNLNVLTVGSKEAKLKIGNATRSILDFKKTNKEENIEELVFHLITTGSGANDYNEMLSEVEKKKIEALSK